MPSATSLQGLADFITVTDTGLLSQVQEGNYQGLVTMMAHLMAVKERTESTNTMFEPLKQTIELLKTYDVEMAEEIHLQLQVGGVGPDVRWSGRRPVRGRTE